MNKLISLFVVIGFGLSSSASETISHSALRAALALSDLSLCQIDLGEGEILSLNPVVVSYTYTLRVGDQTESISFDQDRQTFDYTTDEKTFESVENLNGVNLSGTPKNFKIKLNAQAQLIEAQIGDLVCN